MSKIGYLLIFTVFFFASRVHAQIAPATKLPERDSVEILTQLRSLLDTADSPVSYVLANIAIGNRLFSVKNYSLNAKQGNTNVIIYSPSIGYFHKTGFGLTAGANLLKDMAGFGVNQYSASPSFDLTGNKDIAFGISYTHYFVKDKFSSYSSPIQNDLYTSVTYKKTWLRPGIAIGYSTGEYKESKFKDTLIANVRRHFYDSVTYRLRAFSIMLAVSHQFIWYGVLANLDGLGLTSTLMANTGSGKTKINHKTNAVALFNFLNKRGRITRFQNDKFSLQSVGLNLDLNYAIGAFNFEPQLYIDYYLPASGLKRFTQVFVFNIGYSF